MSWWHSNSSLSGASLHTPKVKPAEKSARCVKCQRHPTKPNPQRPQQQRKWSDSFSSPRSLRLFSQDYMNRRVRTRMHGGVGGRRPQGLPLSRLNRKNSPPPTDQTVCDLPISVGTFTAPRWVPQKTHNGRSNRLCRVLTQQPVDLGRRLKYIALFEGN